MGVRLSHQGLRYQWRVELRFTPVLVTWPSQDHSSEDSTESDPYFRAQFRHAIQPTDGKSTKLLNLRDSISGMVAVEASIVDVSLGSDYKLSQPLNRPG